MRVADSKSSQGIAAEREPGATGGQLEFHLEPGARAGKWRQPGNGPGRDVTLAFPVLNPVVVFILRDLADVGQLVSTWCDKCANSARSKVEVRLPNDTNRFLGLVDLAQVSVLRRINCKLSLQYNNKCEAFVLFFCLIRNYEGSGESND